MSHMHEAHRVADELRGRRNGYHRHIDTPNLTDLGNAERLIARHGKNLRYCAPLGGWLVWDGMRWQVDDTGEIERLAKETVRSIYAEAADEEDDTRRKALADHAKRSEARSRIDAMIALGRSEPGIPDRPADFDADPWLLNAENGTIDLRNGELRDHRREDLITKLIPVSFEPGASAPIFEQFLRRILPPEALRRFLQRAVGYAATGVVSEEMLPILHGVGANGKSTLANVILDAMGDYAMQAPPDFLTVKQRAHPTELADLFGKRFVVCMETEENRRLAESLVKGLTGRERIRARRMRQDFWEFSPTHTVFLGTNHKPEVRGTDHAIWRRLKLVPFDVTIPAAEQDKKLPEKLGGELPGILAWIVRGCVEYQRNGLGEPDEVRMATQGYRTEMDILAAFIEDRCVVHPNASVGATPLYEAYKDWCEVSGENRLTQTKFGRQLKERGFRSEKVQRVTWYGIGLRSDDPGPDPGPGSGLDSSGGDLDSSDSNRLRGEFPIDKGDTNQRLENGRQFRPKTDINNSKSARESVMSEKGRNCLNRLPTVETTTPKRRLTDEELLEVRHLIGEGMEPRLARAAVLGEEHKL